MWVKQSIIFDLSMCNDLHIEVFSQPINFMRREIVMLLSFRSSSISHLKSYMHLLVRTRVSMCMSFSGVSRGVCIHILYWYCHNLCKIMHNLVSFSHQRSYSLTSHLANLQHRIGHIAAWLVFFCFCIWERHTFLKHSKCYCNSECKVSNQIDVKYTVEFVKYCRNNGLSKETIIMSIKNLITTRQSI